MSLQETSKAITAVAASVGQSVVGIGGCRGAGSGVVVAAGQVLTNAHNVFRGEILVTFADGRTASGSVSGADVDGDLAVVSVDTGNTPGVAWGDGTAGIGDAVFGVADPAGRGLRVTAGFVSAVDVGFRGPGGRRINGSIEHTAPLTRGSSGGPVVDADGRLVGINTNRLGDGFYLAVPADAELRRRVEALARGEAPPRPRLGVGIAPPHVAARLRESVGLEPRDGLLVQSVEDDGPAGRAGIRRGDLIVSAGRRPVTTPDELFDVLGGLAPDVSLPLTVVRGTSEVEVAVTFGTPREEGSA